MVEERALNVLALDAATEQGSVALSRGGLLAEARALPPGWSNTSLHGEIAHLLSKHALAIRDIDGYGVTSGPGSFTGVRVGLAAVKGLAEVHGKPIAAVSTLLTVAAAARASSSIPPADIFVAILDARRGQVFGGAFREAAGRMEAIIEESVSSLATLLERVNYSAPINSVPRDRIALCGVDLERYSPGIEEAGWGWTPMIQVSSCLAGTLAQLASGILQDGMGAGAERIAASYVRISDAELFWKG